MLMEADYSVSDLIRLLDLKPHPEGGHYCETFRDAADNQGRAASTAIYFLLAAGEESRWHRIDSVEVWHWYAGAPLLLSVYMGHELVQFRLGMVWREGTDHRSSYPEVPGNRPKASVHGLLSAVRWRRVSSLKNLKLPVETGRRQIPYDDLSAWPQNLTPPTRISG